MRWLLRMSRWSRHPPSPRVLRVILLVAVLSLGLVAIERIWGWPEALTVNHGRRGPGF